MVETKIIADKMVDWYDGYYLNRDKPYWNSEAFRVLTKPRPVELAGWTIGFGFTEAPRGALGHWVKIYTTGDKIGRIENYQCIVASQWNAGPRDDLGQPGPYEQALNGHELADIDQPLEILRTIHSFDPCIGCAVHVVDPEGQPLVQVNINHAYR